MRNATAFTKPAQGAHLTMKQPKRRCSRLMVSFILSLGILLHSAWSVAQDQPTNQSHIIQPTLAIFRANAHDQPIPSGLWSDLVVALREELESGAPELQQAADSAGLPVAADSSIQILRGDQIAPGIVVDHLITVYLHGDCTTDPGIRYPIAEKHQVSGPLGWVLMEHGQIKPFIHVECDHLAQLLRTSALARVNGDRNQRMAAAIAHVILHEWIHIESQNPRHAHRGLAKAEFSVDDLLSHRILSKAQLAPSHCESHPAPAEFSYGQR